MCERIIVTCLLFGTVFNCFSQQLEEKNYKHLTVNDGLSNNYITGIEQDGNGYIWISTSRGLNRFDGISFKQFLRGSHDSPIPDNSIYSMRLFGDHLAIATDDGAQIISTKTLQQKDLLIPTTDALHYWSNACHYVHRDRDGNYGVSTKTGFYIFTSEGKLKKRFDYFTEKDIGKAWMMFGNHLYSLDDGNILQRNSIGLFIYDRNKNYLGDASSYYPAISELMRYLVKKRNNFYFVSSTEILVPNPVTNSFDLVDIKTGHTKSFPACFNLQDEVGWQTKLVRINNSVWAVNSKRDGFFLLYIDKAAKNIVCSSKKYFIGHFCNVFFVDKQNRLWIGTDAGLYMELLSPGIIRSFKIDSGVQRDNFTITSLFITNDRIFAGTEKKTVLIIDKKTRKIIRSVNFNLSSNLSNEITNFQWLNRDTLWVASNSGLNWVNVKNFSTGEILPGRKKDTRFTIDFLYADRQNNIWIPPNKINTIYYYNTSVREIVAINDHSQPLFKINISNSVAEDAKGNIWIGGDAIARWNSRVKKIDTLIEYLPTQRNRKKGFLVMRDSNGEIWIMVNDDGFARITNKPVHVRPENIVPDNKGMFPTLLYDKIFLPTTNGLAYFDLRSLKGIMFNHADGLPESPITSYHFTPDSSDRSTWFACKDMICNIPSSSSYYRQPPLLIINEVSVINDTVISYPQKLIQLKHRQNDVKIAFSAINFTDPENMRFAYRIKKEGDSSWIEAGTQSNLLLTNISPGDYKIEVKAYAYDNKWQEQKTEIEIRVRRPFWQTSVFLTITSLLLAGIFFIAERRRIKQVQQKANLDKLLAQTEMKALHSQMNPHFIFNCLNSIREMILNNENEQASVYLGKFARLIRITLNQSSKAFVSLKDTIDYLQRYIEMEKIRISHFGYSITTDEDLQPDEIMLPPMLIQPFIENAIWHGISPKKNMQINISFLKKRNELVCIVEDNGIGIEESLKKKENIHNEQSVGIANIRQRIELLNEKYNLQSTIRIEDKSGLSIKNGTGTIVTLYLPIKTNGL